MKTPTHQRSQDVAALRGDAFILKLLARSVPLAPSEADAVQDWWRDDAQTAEDLTAFLLRKGIFSPAAPIVIELMMDGCIAEQGLERLYPRDGRRRLQSALRTRVHGEHTDRLPLPVRPKTPPAVVATSPPKEGPATRQEAHSSTATWTDLDVQRGLTETIRTSAASLQVGSMLGGRYLLMEKIGEGTMGLVFRALHRTMNTPVAIKVLHRNVMETHPEAYKRFLAEAQMLARFNHPHIVRVFDFENDGQVPYLVLECIEGLTLADLLQQSGRLQPERALTVLHQVAQALRAAQKIGIVHRDLKPANILLARNGQAKLADLGVAITTNQELLQQLPDAQAQEGMVGSAAYMSPEQVDGRISVDYRSDMYGLGATFYHVLTGQLPFTGRTPMEVLFKHLRQPPRPLTDLVPDLPVGISDLILKMMAKLPEQRFQTYDELLAEVVAQLEALQAPAPAPAPVKEEETARPPSSVWKALGKLGLRGTPASGR